MHIGSWKLHAAFSFKIAIIYFFHQAIILKKQKHQSNAFLTRIRNIYFILIESKKEVIMTKRRQIAIKLLSSNMPIYMYFIVGFFLHQYQPLKIKSISLSDLNFENRSGIRIKLWIELCPSNFHLYYSKSNICIIHAGCYCRCNNNWLSMFVLYAN